MNSGDLATAIEYAHRALELNPSYIDAMNWLYISLTGLGQYDEQEIMLQRILAIDPLSIIGRLNYGSWLAGQNEIERAHEVAEAMLAQNPWAGLSTHAFTAIYNEGNLSDGLSWSLQAYAADPGDLQSNTYLVNSFSWVGEYNEARRISNSLTYLVDVAEGRFDDAIRSTQRKLELDPDNFEVMVIGADVLYFAGRFDEAGELYQRIFDYLPAGVAIANQPYVITRMAFSKREAGDELGAQAAIEIANTDVKNRISAGFDNQYARGIASMLAAYNNDPDSVLAELNSALKFGLRDPLFLDEPLFEAIREDSRFIALGDKLDGILREEHGKVLQLICFNNPAPGAWQPLPATCEGVQQQHRL